LYFTFLIEGHYFNSTCSYKLGFVGLSMRQT